MTEFNLLIRQESSSAPNPTQTSSPSSSRGSQAPYLFFIALGIGVIFTNLWLILGIRYYCRRRRNRLNLESANPGEYNMTDSPNFHRLPNGMYYIGGGVYLTSSDANNPRRRRRAARKLLTQEELDSMFPVLKYKDWSSQQKQKGLPSEGGISDSAAYAFEKSLNNTSNVDAGSNQQQPNSSCSSTETTQSNTINTTTQSESIDNSGSNINDKDQKIQIDINNRTAATPQESENKYPTPSSTNDLTISFSADDEEEEEHTSKYQGPIDSGDTCAICIDSLEPDDDIRALTCHHVFHSDCITPWLTTRRALCPLCKHDYYQGATTSNQQTQESQEDENSQTSERNATTNNTRNIDSNNNNISHASSTPPPQQAQNRSSWDANSRRPSFSTSNREYIGPTSHVYDAQATPIYDEIRHEISELMARIRRSRQERRERRRMESNVNPSENQEALVAPQPVVVADRTRRGSGTSIFSSPFFSRNNNRNNNNNNNDPRNIV